MPFFSKEQVMEKSLYPSGLVKSVTFQQADLTDPKTIEANGLKRKGKQLVTDDEDEVVIYTYTKKELKRMDVA